jgi:hypothetical protein
MRACYCSVPGFYYGPVHVIFVVGKVSLGQVLLRVLRFVLVSAHRHLICVFNFVVLISEGEADEDGKPSNSAPLFRKSGTLKEK